MDGNLSTALLRHWPVKSQHLKQNYPELVIFPAVDNDVDGAV